MSVKTADVIGIYVNIRLSPGNHVGGHLAETWPHGQSKMLAAKGEMDRRGLR